MSDLVIPQFKTEPEEADWWFDNQDQIAEEFLHSPACKNPERGVTARRAALAGAIALDAADALLAREQAERKGISYQSHLQSLLHAAIHAEADRKAG